MFSPILTSESARTGVTQRLVMAWLFNYNDTSIDFHKFIPLFTVIHGFFTSSFHSHSVWLIQHVPANSFKILSSIFLCLQAASLSSFLELNKKQQLRQSKRGQHTSTQPSDDVKRRVRQSTDDNNNLPSPPSLSHTVPETTSSSDGLPSSSFQYSKTTVTELPSTALLHKAAVSICVLAETEKEQTVRAFIFSIITCVRMCSSAPGYSTTLMKAINAGKISPSLIPFTAFPALKYIISLHSLLLYHRIDISASEDSTDLPASHNSFTHTSIVRLCSPKLLELFSRKGIITFSILILSYLVSILSRVTILFRPSPHNTRTNSSSL